MSTLFYKFDLIIRQLWVILSCITLPLNAQIPDIISIDSTVEILNLNNVTLAWADSTAQADVLLAQKAFANLSFKPLAERQLGTKFERAKYSYWLTFALKNQSNDTITLYFNAIRSEFLDIWQEYKGHIERHYQAGKLVEKTTENGYFKGKYDVALSLYPNSEHRFYVCMRHEASVNATIKPMLFSLKQQLNRIQNYTFFNHLYGGFLAVVIFILLLTLFQYFINKEITHLYYALYIFTTWLHYCRLFLKSDNTIYPDWISLLEYKYYVMIALSIFLKNHLIY